MSPYKRILLKLSGESLMGEQKFGIDFNACRNVAKEVFEVHQLGVSVAIVIGGGNIFRAVKATPGGIARTPADHMGMLATVLNGIALHQAFEQISCKSRILSAIACEPIVEAYTSQKALQSLNQGVILIFVGGTGNPYFTTDSAAALRALEISADVVMKGTKVDGIYNKDPLRYPEAEKFDRISYNEVLASQLQVMDATAIALCREHRLPIRVFDLFSDHAFKRAVLGEPVGTLVT